LQQYAQKVARKSRRSTINADDINQAFRHLNVEPIYGISNTSDPFRFVKLAGHAQVMRLSDPVVPVETVLETPLSSPPWEAGLRIHWLAIDGRQPNVPENVQMLKPLRKPKRRKTDILAPEPGEQENGGDGDGEKVGGGGGSDNPGGVLVKAPLKHVLSRELNLYLDRAMGVLEGGHRTNTESQENINSDHKRLLDATLASLRLDAGIQPLAPYICHTLAQNIWVELAGARADEDGDDGENEVEDEDGGGGTKKEGKPSYDPVKLNAHLRASECIASNRTLDLSWYLHELIPAIVDVILEVPAANSSTGNTNKGSRTKEEDGLQDLNRRYRWDQRQFAAKAIASICVWYPEVAPRVQKQFVQSLRANPGTHIPAIYGAIVGIACQGDRAVQTLLLPNLLPLVRNLASHAKACSVQELDIVRDALLSTAGSLLRKQTSAERLLPFSVEMKRSFIHSTNGSVEEATEAEKEVGGTTELPNGKGAPPKAKRTKSVRSQKSSKSKISKSGGKNESNAGLEDFFNDDEQGADPSINFPEDPKDVAASLAWIKKYCKANKGTMEPVSGISAGRFYAATVHKNASGDSEVLHQTVATHKSGAGYVEVFPVSAVAHDAKMLQKAYAEDPRPEEYQRLVHNLFGVQSDPYCVYDENQFLM
jgi:transcription initiation factor TFIID subunit 6